MHKREAALDHVAALAMVSAGPSRSRVRAQASEAFSFVTSVANVLVYERGKFVVGGLCLFLQPVDHFGGGLDAAFAEKGSCG